MALASSPPRAASRAEITPPRHPSQVNRHAGSGDTGGVQDGGRLDGKSVEADRAGDPGHDNAEFAAFALDCVAEDQRRQAGFGRSFGCCGQGERGCRDDTDGVSCRERFRRLIVGGKNRRGRGWQVDLVARDDFADVGERAGIGNCRARCNGGWIVSGNVADRQRHDPSRMSGKRETTTLDGREMFADSIHLDDIRAARQQAFVDGLFVGKCHFVRWQHH